MWSSEFTFGQSMALHILSNFVYKKIVHVDLLRTPPKFPIPSLPTNAQTCGIKCLCRGYVNILFLDLKKKVTSYVRLVLQSKWKLHSIFLSSSASMNDKPVDFQAKTFPMRFFAMKTYFILLCFNNNNLW